MAIRSRVADAKFEVECNHSKRLWIKPSTGAKHWGSHPPLKGKEWYVPAKSWDKSMLRPPEEVRRMEKGMPYLTAASQAYPPEPNMKLASTLTGCCGPSLGQDWKLAAPTKTQDAGIH